MAEKKIIEKKNVKKTANDDANTVASTTVTKENVDNTEETNLKDEKLEEIKNKVNDKVEEVMTNLSAEVAEIKAQEQELMQKIEENPEKTAELIKNELERLDDVIANVDETIQKLEKEVNNKRVFITSDKWNGWGYGD